ncbi:phosphatidylinositol 4-phosphate 5-kinase type-1 gamma [Caerostris extrusa]|uniref:Phosphatidylinositol 4-phosphate 5-kinase type-1 gamma n=1 Tax=Caerostris extrusa TaxID=172846 RepID=A0AAV4QJQ7_CAEEX|nr:phosphatidylinositol 4-phosphate 5-kinase type-1 gamma [Caerostris extrusa]
MERHTEGIFLEADTYNALMKTITRDCRVLESFKIMDYSLLVGIHNLDAAKREKCITSPSIIWKSDTSLVRSKSINRTRLAAFSTAMESIQAEVEVVEEDDVPPGGIPAKILKEKICCCFWGIIDILQSYRLKKKLEHTLKSVLHDGDTVSVHRPSFYAQRFLQFMSGTVFKNYHHCANFMSPHQFNYTLKHSPSKRKGAAAKKASADHDLPPRLPKIPSESECPQEEDSASSAPVPFPPTFSEIETTTVTSDLKSSNSTWSSSRERQKPRANTDPVPLKMISFKSSTSSVGKTSSVTWDKTEVVSLSQITIQTESTGDCVSETSSSSTSGLGSTLHTVTYTPPHSVEGSTPTHTEGTPSFTESSSSGDAACPTTPVKSINKSLDSLPPLGETQILQGSEMTRL